VAENPKLIVEFESEQELKRFVDAIENDDLYVRTFFGEYSQLYVEGTERRRG